MISGKGRGEGGERGVMGREVAGVKRGVLGKGK